MARKAAKSKKSVKVAKATKTVVKVKGIKLVKEPMSKSQILATISDATGLAKKEVSLVMEGLTEVIHAHLKKGSAGAFNLPGLLKLYVVRKPATKARKGVNPFTGEEVMFKAKPARNIVKARVLKKLKDVA